MKNNILKLTTLILMFFASNLHADETYICTFGQQGRVISIIYDNQDIKVPCEVRYRKDGQTKTLWHAKGQVGFCEERAEEFVQKHIDWGWRCSDTTLSKSPIVMNGNTLSTQQINEFRIAAAFAQSIAVVSPIKIQSIEFYSQSGEFPSRLEDIGIHSKDMKSSSYISDLTLGDNGEILIKGNEVMGLDTVVMLKPRLTLGGLSIEWRCYTNIKVKNVDFCDHRQNLMFK